MSQQGPFPSRNREPRPSRQIVAPLAGGALLVIALLVAMWLAPKGVFDDGPQLQAGAGMEGDVAVVRVEEGEGVASIASKLESLGVIESARLFRVLVALQGVGDEMAAGDYEFELGEPTGLVIERLQSGATAGLQVTIPEGRRTEEAAILLAEANVLPAPEFERAASQLTYDYDFVGGIPEGQDLTGFLFPDTYQFSKLATAEDIVELMLSTFQTKVLTDETRAMLQETDLTLYEVVTLAAIVEREAEVPDERPIIASVFLNRLAEGMLLQADPTVQFALAEDPSNVQQFGYWKQGLTEEDLDIDSPYNTYVYAGLPPGPIANPGLDAILAVLRPADTDYLYFVAKPDGSHAFASTLDEHNANVQQYGGG